MSTIDEVSIIPFPPFAYGCEWCDDIMSTSRCSRISMCIIMAGYIEAQMKQRTAYISKAMVRPLKTPLNDRIVALAHEAVLKNQR